MYFRSPCNTSWQVKHVPCATGLWTKTPRGLRAALKGINTVIHLAGTELLGIKSDLDGVDIEGTRAITSAAREVGVDRFLFLSYIGSDKASAFPVLKAKAIAENSITHSGIPYTIFRTAVVYGPNDHFTHSFARMIKMTPYVFLIPGDGSNMLQPIHIQDRRPVSSRRWKTRKAPTGSIRLAAVNYYHF